MNILIKINNPVGIPNLVSLEFRGDHHRQCRGIFFTSFQVVLGVYGGSTSRH